MDYTFVEISGKKYPVKFGFNALRKYGIKTNTSLQDLDGLGNNMKLNDALTLILWSGGVNLVRFVFIPSQPY
jgi:hypothetical protein